MKIIKQVHDPCGVHGRPSGAIINVLRAIRRPCTLNGQTVTHPADILAMGLKQGDTLRFDLEGDAPEPRLEGLRF